MAADLTELREKFEKATFLTFGEINGLVRADIKSVAAEASIFLQGAHLTAWRPEGEMPVIFFSRESDIAPGKPMRGGIPVVFPWFAGDQKKDRVDGHPGPSHGFARVQAWELERAEMKGNDAVLEFSLVLTEMSRSMGFDKFQLRLRFVVGKTLTMKLEVRNLDEKPLEFEEAFHTYFHVMDIHEVSIRGLEQTGFIDKTDHFARKAATHAPITFTGPTDRIYEDTAGPCSIRDGAGGRTILLRKTGSETTVVWNPGRELPDVGPWEWHEMVAVETANVARNRVTLAAGARKEMGMTVTVERQATGA